MSDATPALVPKAPIVPPSKRRIWLWGLAAVLFVSGTVVGWRDYHAAPLSELPNPDLSRTHRKVTLAIEQAQRAVENSPRSGPAWGRLGCILRAHDFGPEANRCLAMAERLDPHEFLWPYLLGVTLSITDFECAAACFQRAIAIRDVDALPRIRLAELLIDRKQLQEAERLLQEAIHRDKANAQARLVLARVCAAAGRLDQARNLAQESVHLAPNQRATHEFLLQLAFRTADGGAAAEERKILGRLPEGETTWDDPYVASVLQMRRDAVGLARQANDLLAAGRTAEGLRLLDEVVADNPDDPQWPVLYARLLVELRDLDRALSVINAARLRHPESGDLEFQRGIVFFFREQWSSAAEAFRRVTSLRPDHDQGWYNLGQTLKRLDDPTGAIRAFRAAVRIQPGMAPAHANIGQLLLEAGESDAAREALESAARLDPSDPLPERLLKGLRAENSQK